MFMLFVVGTFSIAIPLGCIHFRGSGHLKMDSSWIMGRSFSYDTLRGVRLDWSGWRCSPCPLLDCLRWLVVLGFLATSLLADWPMTKIYCVVAQTSSLSIEYLFIHLNKSSIVTRGFLARDFKNGVPV